MKTREVALIGMGNLEIKYFLKSIIRAFSKLL